MRAAGTARYWLVGCALLAACKADIPEGIFRCTSDEECPDDFACRSAPESDKTYCYADRAEAGSGAGTSGTDDAGNVAGSGGDDAGPQAGSGDTGATVPTAARFSALGEPRRGDGIALYDEAFDHGERHCSSDRSLCVTGGFEP